MQTPEFLFSVISNPAWRFVGGWDYRAHDVHWITPRPGITCLEVGAGAGFFSTHVRAHLGTGAHLVTLDLFPESLRRLVAGSAQHPPAHAASLSAAAADAAHLPFADSSLDCVFYSFSLEELPEPLLSVDEAARVLRPGGQLVLFLWKVFLRRQRREAIYDRLEGRFTTPVRSEGPQNVRLSCRRLPVPHPALRPPAAAEVAASA